MNLVNIFQMYHLNDCRFGFYIHRNSWASGRYAKVVDIDDVIEGKKINGDSPYFTQYYPVGHPKEGKVKKRHVTLQADWLDDGVLITDCGGNFSWTQVHPA